MPSQKSSLDDLRREIDEIDDAIHDLLMRRTQVVEHIGVRKGNDRVFMRPAREAVILRRLFARHTGQFSHLALARIWREMISALTRIQGPFAVAVFAPEERRGFWDVARDHYGSQTPMIAVNTPVAAVRAVSDGTATVGVVPWPDEEDSDPWWRFLMSDDAKSPRVVARLPFVGRGNARGDDGDALAIAQVAHEATGDDRTLLGVELAGDVSRGRLKDTLEACGLSPTGFRSWLTRDGAAGSLHLVEVDDFVSADDPRFPMLRERFGDLLVRVTTLGGYAVPLALAQDSRKA